MDSAVNAATSWRKFLRKQRPLPKPRVKKILHYFSDLSGYTATSERLSPEEVKETMGRILGKIAQVVIKYEGFIEKSVGDVVMALFVGIYVVEPNHT
jgi:class 3 adenylate cyclase